MKRREGFRPYSKKPSRLFYVCKDMIFFTNKSIAVGKKNVIAFRD